MFSIIEDDVPAIAHQDLFRRAGPIPELRIEGLTKLDIPPPTVVARSPDTSTTSSSASVTTSCGPKDTTGPCERMEAVSGNTTLPIVLGVVIPLTVAFVLMIILHRRHVKKLRREDAEDADKSLDFGLDGTPPKKKKIKKNRKGGQKIPEMSITDAQGAVRTDRGVSLDLGVVNPYLLPPELQSSRESLHSLSRSINTGDDKYRVTSFIPDDGSVRSPSSLRSHWDDSSTMGTSSTKKRMDSESTRGLISQPLVRINEAPPSNSISSPLVKGSNSFLAPGLQDPVRDSYMSTTSSNGAAAAFRASNNYLGQFISGGKAAKKEPVKKEETRTSVMELEGSLPIQEPAPAKFVDEPSKRRSVVPEQAKHFSHDASVNVPKPQKHDSTVYHELTTENPRKEFQLPLVSITGLDDMTSKRQSSVYEDDFELSPPIKPQVSSTLSQVHDAHTKGINVPPHSEKENQRQSNLLHPGHDSTKQRESEYYDEESYDIDEYADVLGYDPRMLGMGQRPLPPDDPSENPEERALKIRSFYKEYFDDSAKPAGAAAQVSYYDGSENYIDDYYRTTAASPYGARGPSSMGAPQARHRATVSNGTYRVAGPRAYTSASGQAGPHRPAPKKNLPLPGPLLVLPTPSKLQDDSMLPNAIDFAPPQVFRNQRAGTPDSMKGGQRPYSPSTRAYNPLVSSFDDLAALPSPHALRKSGTFTSLDFAPPRFVPAEGNGSETGSIRSTRSGVSAAHQHNIRNGAYRVSRLPKEVAGTRDEMSLSLRPQWDMSRK